MAIMPPVLASKIKSKSPDRQTNIFPLLPTQCRVSALWLRFVRNSFEVWWF